MKSNSHYKSEDITIEDIVNCLNDLESIDSFFILERGDCSYLQCINYKGHLLIEERVYKDNSFKHYVLGHDYNIFNENEVKKDGICDTDESIMFNVGYENKKSYFNNDRLAIDDKFFKRFSNELFSLEETINIFTNYYTNIPFEFITKRDITHEFGELEEGFIFIKWLNSAVDSFKEDLDEFITIIEPFIIDELKKDCIGRKIVFDEKMIEGLNFPENEDINNEDINGNNIKCSVFQVIDIFWAVESIIEIAKKYEFIYDIVIFKKKSLEDIELIKISIEDFS
ncbi:MAG: hypothetical protein ISP01_04985 [Methanobrevibacter arboriphilus]|uniref:Uncharacterized protein n=1 Tax=Methanobrevibacter arboriphilus TaxID=39441 RepID=A0A843AG47_METAZ|nr:hypothetical protein [Methanobrevibacter arboriphilus]MBF4468741.1 hypothetical protein [Methanobrevibacter arboriphilus]